MQCIDDKTKEMDLSSKVTNTSIPHALLNMSFRTCLMVTSCSTLGYVTTLRRQLPAWHFEVVPLKSGLFFIQTQIKLSSLPELAMSQKESLVPKLLTARRKSSVTFLLPDHFFRTSFIPTFVRLLSDFYQSFYIYREQKASVFALLQSLTTDSYTLVKHFNAFSYQYETLKAPHPVGFLKKVRHFQSPPSRTQPILTTSGL